MTERNEGINVDLTFGGVQSVQHLRAQGHALRVAEPEQELDPASGNNHNIVTSCPLRVKIYYKQEQRDTAMKAFDESSVVNRSRHSHLNI